MVPNIGLFCRNSDNRVEKYDYVSLLSGKIRIVMNYARTLRSDHRIPISFKLIWIEFVCIIRKLFQINLVMKTYCAIKHITYAVALLMYSNSIELVLNGNDTDMLPSQISRTRTSPAQLHREHQQPYKHQHQTYRRRHHQTNWTTGSSFWTVLYNIIFFFPFILLLINHYSSY